MTNEFDDPDLERMLGRLSGAYPDTNVAYQAVHGRVRQVKRRRAFVAGTAACAMLFGVAAVAAQGVGPSQTVSPAAPADTSVVVTASSTPAPTDAPSTTASDTSMVDTSMVETSTVDTIIDTTAPDQGGGTPSSTPGVTAAPTTSAASSTTDATSPGNPSTTATLPLGEHTWTSDGGSITVVNDNGALTLVSTDPAVGFQEVRSDASSDRIRVEFSDGSTTWRIEIRTDGGKARAEITRHG